MRTQHSHAAPAETRRRSAYGAGAKAATASPTTTTAGPACPETSSPQENAAARKRAKALRVAEDRILALIATSGHVEKTITAEALKGSFFSLPTGRALNVGVCERLIENGRLLPSGDGLFGDSQTFVPAVV